MGAELRSKDEHGQTPLPKAAEDGHEAIVRLLLERIAPVQIERWWRRQETGMRE